jgi:hypothetical protein
MHSMAMTKDFMDRLLRWHQASCPLEIVLQAIQLVMSGTLPSHIQLTLDMRTLLTRHLEQVAFDAGAWTLWTRYCPTPSGIHTHRLTYHFGRCFELVKLQRKDISLDVTLLDAVLKKYLACEPLTPTDGMASFEIFLSHRKGWQRKVDKGLNETDLRCESADLKRSRRLC